MLRLAGKIEALLFSASSPVSEKELKSALNVSTAEIKDALEELRILLEDEAHGIFLKQLAGNWTLETKPELGDLVGNFRNTSKIKRFSLSRAVMEVLTIIAYKQPISRREVEEIRGVDSSSPINRLLWLGLIKISGRIKNRAAIYSTTKKFLEIFGINSLDNLPAIDEIDDVDEVNEVNDDVHDVHEINDDETSSD
ncbi:MAG: SMC-Scp complex subunit ScpB [Synergistaceae bacterium]|nr:SMC-Scp complex subunit ScpB [Synergistaceae bacterium]